MNCVFTAKGKIFLTYYVSRSFDLTKRNSIAAKSDSMRKSMDFVTTISLTFN